MTGPEYQEALRSRGFHYHEKLDQWVGPFNLRVAGFFNNDIMPGIERSRADALAVVDEQLRAKREAPRPRSSGGASPGLL